MKMNGKRVAAASLAALVAVSGSKVPAVAAEKQTEITKLSSPVLITEVIPNTDNMGGADAYEYYELTNISDQEVDLSNYHIVYVNGSTKTIWDPDIQKIPANSSMLVWIKNDGNVTATKADFCKYYGITEDSLVAEVTCGGLHNSKTRSVAVATATGQLLTYATYTPADSSEGKLSVNEAVVFTYDGDNSTTLYDQTPTPYTVGVADIVGIYTAPEAVSKPTVTVTEVSELEENTALNVEVTSTNLGLENIISGKIIINGTEEYDLMLDSDNKLIGTIPFADLSEKGVFKYQVSVFDGTNTAVSEKQIVSIKGADLSTIDRTKAPALAITELLPDSSNMNGSDAYEFIEIYNNSESAINLKDYRLNYLYPDTGVSTTWWETSEDKILESGQTLVFWVDNGGNTTLTLDDFNEKYGAALTEDQLIKIECGGMANGSLRGVSICTNTGEVIDSVIYNDGVDNTTVDKSITYQNQYINNLFETVMTGDTQTPTPGTISADEKAFYQAEIVVPEEKPTVEDQTGKTFSNDTEEFNFIVKAISEETTIKTVKLYLKYEGQDNFESYNLTASENGTFTKTIENIDLVNKKNYTYYFTVSDGFATVKTDETKVTNTDAADTAQLNVKDGDTFTEKQQLIAYGEKLLINGTDVTGQSKKSINGYGKIAFDATETDVFFKNAVAVGGDVVGVFNEGTYSAVRTYAYDVDASKFDAETKTITVEFHAGNKANVLEHNIENNDDFVIRNVRMVLPNGKTLTPVSYQAKKGLGAVEHTNMDEVEKIDVSVASQESNISMGDGTSKYEIVYVTFQLEDSDFESIRYTWDTTQVEDGKYTISNGQKQVTVNIDNTAPEITTNMEDGKLYHNGTIEVEAKDNQSEDVTTVMLLDGKNIEVPYDFRCLEMQAGEHTLSITSRDEVGNVAEKVITFSTPNESAEIDGTVLPENGGTVTTDPTLSVKAFDESNDEMTVTFKTGERYEMADSNITKDSGISNASGSIEKVFEENTGNGFPYDSFQIELDDTVDDDTVVGVEWTGTSNNAKTYMYVYNVTTGEWEKLDAVQTVDGENMTLAGEVTLKDHLTDGHVNVIVQNGEGYTPTQYEADTQSGNVDQSGVAAAAEAGLNATDGSTPTYNVDDTPRSEYDFTFAIESDTQYYNEDYEGNVDQSNNGVYQHQLNIHNWILANRERMNIQYLFHDGDIIDDEPNVPEWEQASKAYELLDNAGLPYGILAGNHDVGHLGGDYTNYSTYFGESRYADNAWYGESYKDNRGHYDLITVGGIDFIMIYMGWGIGDDEIQWMNDVLAQYPERKAILNFHEYLLASGGLGEEPQRVHDEVIAKNENVCMVFSGHYHNAKTTIDTFTNADGSTRKVYNMLFDYQGLNEGGSGYMRLLHFDLEGEKVTVRTYTPSYGGSDINNYGDYDAKESETPNEGNDFVIEGAALNDSEHFEITFEDLGITSSVKTLETTDLKVNVYKNEVIETVAGVTSGTEASCVWTKAAEGVNGWYAEVTDENGGLSRTDVYYVNVNRDTEAPVLTIPENTTLKVGDKFDVMDGVSATDNVDQDVTGDIIVTGKVNTSIAGTYELTYEVTDQAGNKSVKTRVVVVREESSDKTGDSGETDQNISGNDSSISDNKNNISDNNSNKGNLTEKDSKENNQKIESAGTGDMVENAGYSVLAGISGLLLSLAGFLGKFKRKDN